MSDRKYVGKGFKPRCKYLFRVAAENKAGVGPYAESDYKDIVPSLTGRWWFLGVFEGFLGGFEGFLGGFERVLRVFEGLGGFVALGGFSKVFENF